MCSHVPQCVLNQLQSYLQAVLALQALPFLRESLHLREGPQDRLDQLDQLLHHHQLVHLLLSSQEFQWVQLNPVYGTDTNSN